MEPGGRAENSEDRNDSAVVGLFNILLHSVGLERLDKRLDLGAAFFTCAAGDDAKLLKNTQLRLQTSRRHDTIIKKGVLQ